MVEEPIQELAEDVVKISPNMKITLSTEDGYFKINNKSFVKNIFIVYNYFDEKIFWIFKKI